MVRTVSIALVGLTLAVAPIAPAATIPAALASDGVAVRPAAGTASVPTAPEVAGRTLRALDGQALGEIVDAIADANGKLIAVVVETGGLLGVAETRRVLPVARLRVTEQGVFTELSASSVGALPTEEDWSARRGRP